MKEKRRVKIEELQGKYIKRVETDEYSYIKLFTEEGVYIFEHYQNCCESVTIDDICGDIHDLESLITVAEERVSSENPEGIEIPEYQDSFTWTFYHFETTKGYVDIRWYGESNGYYSEEVDLYFEYEKVLTYADGYKDGYREATENARKIVVDLLTETCKDKDVYELHIWAYVRENIVEPMEKLFKDDKRNR